MPKNRWSVIATFAAAATASQMAWLTFTSLTTVAADRYGVSEAAIGWLANVFLLGFVAFAIPAGFLLDRNLRRALRLGAILTALGASVRVAGDSYALMLIGGSVAALGQPILLTGIVGLVREYLRPEQRATGIAVTTAATWAGFVGAATLSVVYSDSASIPRLLAVHASFAVAAAIALVLALRSPAPFAPDRGARQGASLAKLRAAWNMPLIRRLCFFAFIPFGVFLALITWLQALLAPSGVLVDQAGVILICAIVAGVVGTAMIPVLAARVRKELAAGICGTLIAALACALLAAAPGFGSGLVAMSLIGFMLLPMLAITLTLVKRHQGEDDGVSSGLIWTWGNLGGLVISGVIGSTVAWPSVSFMLLAVVTLSAIPLLLRLRTPVAALPSTPSIRGGERDR